MTDRHAYRTPQGRQRLSTVANRIHAGSRSCSDVARGIGRLGGEISEGCTEEGVNEAVISGRASHSRDGDERLGAQERWQVGVARTVISLSLPSSAVGCPNTRPRISTASREQPISTRRAHDPATRANINTRRWPPNRPPQPSLIVRAPLSRAPHASLLILLWPTRPGRESCSVAQQTGAVHRPPAEAFSFAPTGAQLRPEPRC